MQYYEIDSNSVFNKRVSIDEENALICYDKLVVGEIEKMTCGVKYRISLPTIKDARFNDVSITAKDIFTDSVKVDSRGGIFIHSGNRYIKIGYEGAYLEILLPYICKAS